MADATQGLPDIQSLLGNVVGQIGPSMQQTSDQMGALQDYIKSQQKDQMNIPALQFAAGLLKPTKTGSFGESVGEAGSGALDALQKQRGIDLDRQAKILELQQGKNSLLAQQAQMLTPFWQYQQANKLADSLMPGAPGGGGATGDGSSGSDAGPSENALERATMLSGALGPAGKGISDAATLHMRFGPQMAGQREFQQSLNKPYSWIENGTEVSGTFGQYLQKFGKMPDAGGIPNPPLMKLQARPALTSAAATPDAPAQNAPAQPAAPPGPTIDPATSAVKSVIPASPPGGGFPVVPSGATGLPPGYEDQANEAAKVPTQWAKDAGDLDTMKNRFRELNYLGKLTESNQWATSKAAIAAHLKALTLQMDPNADVSKIDADKWGNPADVQQEVKDVTQLAMAAARAQSSRGTNMVLQEAMLTTPMADMQPAARWNLINHGIASIDRRQQMMADWQQAQTKGWKDPNVFEQTWLKANPIDKWNQATSEKAGNFAGMPLPATLRPGVVYVAPKNAKNPAAAGQLFKWDGKKGVLVDPNDMTGIGLQ